MAGVKEMLHKPVFEQLGEAQVRLQFSSQTDDVGREARYWLHELQLQRDLEASAKRDLREEETLSISRKALSITNRANIIAISAIIIAAACTIISIVITFKLGK